MYLKALVVYVLGLACTEVFGDDLFHSAVLDVNGKFHIAWSFNDVDITFEMTAQTTGYIGLGFSPNGDMPGSDIVIGWVDDSTGTGYISDRHATSQSTPLVDAVQDYTLLSSNQNTTHTLLRFRRKIKLCGTEDHYITEETVRLIWAYNDRDPGTDMQPLYHGVNRGNKNMFLLNPQTSIPAEPETLRHEVFFNPQYTIPDDDTTYWCQAFAVPKLNTKHHVIKIEPVITPGLEAVVHHIVLYGCYHETNSSLPGRGHVCYHPNMPQDFIGCAAVVYAWAIGGGPLYFPAEAGYPFGYEGDPTMILMQTHFDNPQRRSGLVDSSGFRMTLTSQLREHDAGTLQTGAVVNQQMIIPPYAKSFRINGHCYPQCLSQAMANAQNNLTAFAYFLHTHLLGHAVRVRHFRKGRELPLIGQDNHYDFNFQETRMLAKRATVLPGDHFVVECDYTTESQTKVTYAGLSTREEMCLGYILYYPKIKLTQCESSPPRSYLASLVGAELGGDGAISTPEKWKGKQLSDVMTNEVDWTSKEVRDVFETGINKEGVGFYPRCMNGRTKYPLEHTLIPRPLKLSTLPPYNKKCDVNDGSGDNDSSGAMTTRAADVIILVAILAVTIGFISE